MENPYNSSNQPTTSGVVIQDRSGLQRWHAVKVPKTDGRVGQGHAPPPSQKIPKRRRGELCHLPFRQTSTTTGSKSLARQGKKTCMTANIRHKENAGPRKYCTMSAYKNTPFYLMDRQMVPKKAAIASNTTNLPNSSQVSERNKHQKHWGGQSQVRQPSRPRLSVVPPPSSPCQRVKLGRGVDRWAPD